MFIIDISNSKIVLKIHYRLFLVYFAINKVAKVDFELEELIERPGKRLGRVENLADPFFLLKPLKVSLNNLTKLKRFNFCKDGFDCKKKT